MGISNYTGQANRAVQTAVVNVMPLIHSKEDWLEPWYPIEDAARAGALLKELRAELSKSHVIYGSGAHAIGARQDCDDVVFELSDGKCAVVHLTYAQHPESNPVYPSTEIFENWESFVATCMTTDHDDWTA
jgi:hypothetical protein